jgi:hypothetical protein
MFARVTRIQVPAEQLDEAARRLNETSSTIQGVTGFRRAYLLVDRQRGEALTVTLWETREQLEASQGTARQLLTGVFDAVGGSVSEPGSYEVLIEVSPTAS